MQDVQYITGFTAGELTPWLSTRFDLQAYRRGAALLSNFDVLPYGGIKRRHGTEYLGEAAEQGGGVRLLPFCYSESDALMLELFPGKMRVYRHRALLRGDDGTIYELATPWTSCEELAALRATQINDVLYVTSPYQPPYRLERYADTEWKCVPLEPDPFPRETYLQQESELRVQVTSDGSYATIESKYPAPAFTPEMVNRETLLTEMSVAPRTLFLNQSFSFKAIDTPDLSSNIVPYGTICREHDADAKLYYYYTAVKGYEPTLFNGGTSAADYPDVFLPGVMRTDADNMPYEVCGDWEVRTNGEWNAIWELWRSYDTVSTHTNCSNWQWSVIRTIDQTSYSERKNWAISGSESEPCRMVLVCRAAASEQLGAHIYFRTGGGMREYRWDIVQFINERKVRASLRSFYAEPCSSYRTRRWSFGAFGSRNGYPTFSGVYQDRLWLGGIRGLPTTLLASAVGDYRNFRVGSLADDALHLSLATDNQSKICWILPSRNLLVGSTESEWALSAADGAVLSGTNAAFQRHSSVGSADMPAKGLENTVLYVQRGGKRLRELSYKLEADGYTSTDTSLLAEHLFHSGVKEWVVQRGEAARVWVLMMDGSLAVLTLNAEQNVTAWQRVEFPGREVLHLAALSSATGREDEMWLVLKCRASGFVSIECAAADAGYLDGVCTLESGADSFYHAPHLGGTEVVVYASAEPESARRILLPPDGRFTYTGTSPVCVGAVYRSTLQTMPYENERSFNSVRQEGRVRLRLLESYPEFFYKASCAEDWEHFEPQLSLLPECYTGSIRVSQMPIPRVGQGFCLAVDGRHDFCLLSLSIEFDFHGK